MSILAIPAADNLDSIDGFLSHNQAAHSHVIPTVTCLWATQGMKFVK